MNKKRIQMLLLLLFMLTGTTAKPNYKMHYTVDFDRTNHYLNIGLQVDFEHTVNETLTLEMPVWAPGYYIILDYPKHLTDFVAQGSDGPFRWLKTSKNRWSIDVVGRRLKVNYRVYANERSVAESRVGHQSAFIAPNGVFMYFLDDKNHEVTVDFRMPADWKRASTGMKSIGPNNGSLRTFLAPDFDTLFDSPLLFGNHYVTFFNHEGHAYEFALETPDGFEQCELKDDFKRMVSQASKLIGHIPYDNYCLIHLGAGGGGLEHLNSQACYSNGSFHFASRKEYLQYLSFVTHEYFHLYNVKTIRPYELGPFDYSRECYTPLLWVSEGFTCYYECRLLLLADIVDGYYLLNDLSNAIRNTETSEGHLHMSLRQSSYDIWLNFFSHSDHIISYYDKGPIFGLLFDIEIRYLTGGRRGLDDLMRLLYNRYYRQLERGFTEEEFWQASNEIAGKSLSHLRHLVDTTDTIPYDTLLSHGGLGLNRDTWQLYLLQDVSHTQQVVRQAIIGQ